MNESIGTQARCDARAKVRVAAAGAGEGHGQSGRGVYESEPASTIENEQ
jgi:hypothetical protein